ncbi:L-threonylcarbamoyladenylate synthase [Alkalisalibacterium limincola]|uniref:Threonylcarbamoyl-AMP synthase n=1 Tax=Alkalisalibacterium limincola TaxID=2699169 RepID=A0A5C8KKG2_9GAMM|nr:Sua5/YciO/YrdC/YwlC family protein [Alkalisalibacterium limincola]TXK59737.1 tRNA threonylcarbamoyladenosine biosynthesis protein RimN [Alkalisalibacterium limincola]
MAGTGPRRIDPARAGVLLRQGGVLVYPTEAVWGIGCDPGHPGAVQRLLDIKQRPVAKGMIVVCDTLARVADWVDLDALPAPRREAVLASWPGPNTWTLPATADAPRMLCGDHDTLAVRVSAHPVVRALCAAFGGALVSTSANRAGEPPAFEEAALDPRLLADVDALVEGRTGGLAAPTPIRDARSGEILRS